MAHYRLHHDPKSSHQQIARLTRRLGQSPVLDVGAAQGILGQVVVDSRLVLDAIEPHPAWAEQARPYYRQVFADPVEAAPLPARTYRTIVCADVLEHTVDPRAVLRRLGDVAAHDALFIVSLPNVAHLAVRVLLLLGRFPRMERGVLDRTHLHFYTRDTAQALLEDAGFEVLQVTATGLPLDELWPAGEGRLGFRLLTRLQHVALALAPRLCGWQWIFVARQSAAGRCAAR